jgi:hypothetical protein
MSNTTCFNCGTRQICALVRKSRQHNTHSKACLKLNDFNPIHSPIAVFVICNCPRRTMIHGTKNGRAKTRLQTKTLQKCCDSVDGKLEEIMTLIGLTLTTCQERRNCHPTNSLIFVNYTPTYTNIGYEHNTYRISQCDSG